MKQLTAVLLVLLICHGFAHEQNSKIEPYALLEIEASKCMPECLECQNGPNSCTKCSQGHNCCNRECSQCQNQTICKACKQDFKLDEKLNICVSEFSCDELWCEDCDYQNYICTKCYEGYFLNSQMLTCDKCQQECIFCQSLDNCTLCTPGTYLDKGDCLKCQQNCQECKNNVTCDFCAQSYYIDKTGKCTKCIDSCMKCTSAQNCQQCQPRFYYNNDTNKCLPCQQTCFQCKNSNQCIKCEPGYFFNKTLKTCQQCQQFYPHCMNCHDTQSNISNTFGAISTTVCITCEPRYYVSKNQCISCPQNCIQCQRQNQCQDCAQRYFLNQSKLCQQCNIMYCLVCQKSDICRICQQKYYWNPDMSRSQCLRCPYGCNQCDKFTCSSCLTGFYLKNGNCYRCDSACYSCDSGPVDCTMCMPGFFKIQYDKGRCIKCAQPCLECKNMTSCKKCVPGFYLQNDICKKCQIQGCDQCQLSDEVTTFDVTADYDDSNPIIQMTQKLTVKACIRCSQSYLLINSTCKKCMPGCQRCMEITFCNACYRGYSRTQQGQQCIKCPQHCRSCDINPTNTSQVIIRQCQAGYTRDSSSKKCIPCVKNCKLCTQTSDNFCIDCFQGYYRLFTDQPSRQCLPCQAPCKLCQSLTQCLSCVTGYYMNTHDQCIKCKQGCQQCNQYGCFVCQQGYKLNTITLQCEKCNIKNCLHCKQSIDRCDACQQGYTHYDLETNLTQMCYRCDQSIQGCKQCSSPYTCTECFNGLVLAEVGGVNGDGLVTTNSCVANNNDNNNNDNFQQQIIFYAIIGALAIICLALTVIIFKIKRKSNSSPTKINKKVIKPNQAQTLMQTSQQSISPIDIVISSNKNTRQNKKSSVFNSFTGIN